MTVSLFSAFKLSPYLKLMQFRLKFFHKGDIGFNIVFRVRNLCVNFRTKV